MKKVIRRFRGVDRGALSNVGLEQAFESVKRYASSNFDESVDLALRLRDLKKGEVAPRGSVVLPSGLGKKVRVAVFADEKGARDALEAGASFAGGRDFVDRVKAGFFEFDVCVSTPAMMVEVSKLGRVLGPRGLMPNPKLGTVSEDVAAVVRNSLKGCMRYNASNGNIVHGSIGRASFSSDQLKDNFLAVVREVLKSFSNGSPADIERIFFSTTMGPSVSVCLSGLKEGLA